MALTRTWITRDPTARPWLVALHRRGAAYARAQLWQIKKELPTSGLLGSVVEDVPGRVHFDPDTLLRAVLHAAERLADDERREGRSP